MNVSDKSHPHHAVWREHVQSVLDGNPKTVIRKYLDFDGWEEQPMSENGFCGACWFPGGQYRIARPMVTRTITYPAPLTEAPADGAIYWVINSSSTEVASIPWRGDKYEYLFLKRGIAFATEEDAKAAAHAIFGAQE